MGMCVCVVWVREERQNETEIDKRKSITIFKLTKRVIKWSPVLNICSVLIVH